MLRRALWTASLNLHVPLPPLPPAAHRMDHMRLLGGVTHTVSGCLALHSSHLCTCSPKQQSRESYIGIRAPIPRHHVDVAICTCPSKYAVTGAWAIPRMETASVLHTCPLASDHQRITGAKPRQFCKSADVLMQKLAWRYKARPRSSATQNILEQGAAHFTQALAMSQGASISLST